MDWGGEGGDKTTYLPHHFIQLVHVQMFHDDITLTLFQYFQSAFVFNAQIRIKHFYTNEDPDPNLNANPGFGITLKFKFLNFFLQLGKKFFKISFVVFIAT